MMTRTFLFRIFRVLANEVFYGGQVDKGLLSVLERLLDEKEGHLVAWNERVLDR